LLRPRKLFPDPDMVLHWDSVHDGWGIAREEGLKGDAIEAGTTTNMDTIAKKNVYRTLAAHGLAVGLSDGLMGNSEVGFVLAPCPPSFD
jgi:bisphosphoglycerate-independent phosphoglycerate mutase (AlkP superfamily)